MAQLPQTHLKKALTIASSDSGGGAGIEADLKTFAALRVFGLCVISAVTAQNTVGVSAMEPLSPQLVKAQLKAVFDDIGAEAIKIGLLGYVENTIAAAYFIKELKARPPIILDPVMVSAGGHVFLDHKAVEALAELFPLCDLLTPNLPEACVLSGVAIKKESDYIKAGEIILNKGPKRVLIKGGHAKERWASDYLIWDGGTRRFSTERVETKNTHGTGCTLSSAIAAHVALGYEIEEAVNLSKLYVTESLKNSIYLGRGPGPLNHFHRYYQIISQLPLPKRGL
ncbi:MAG: bifunctional hydroxymethylpyrimidine kinase/phosphomethylpyrimidine kinase [Deltaproteobacteria bacterium]|jgi:hydroxymethylpyrimidine/phosphomethylpyrimidine kinase|nr:bifunctional hydroxymethylpyrimidine kinase/phosphomethylpyrimidine kinase [Deltaproteobacteria bacterium]